MKTSSSWALWMDDLTMTQDILCPLRLCLCRSGKVEFQNQLLEVGKLWQFARGIDFDRCGVAIAFQLLFNLGEIDLARDLRDCGCEEV